MEATSLKPCWIATILLCLLTALATALFVASGRGVNQQDLQEKAEEAAYRRIWEGTRNGEVIVTPGPIYLNSTNSSHLTVIQLASPPTLVQVMTPSQVSNLHVKAIGHYENNMWVGGWYMPLPQE